MCAFPVPTALNQEELPIYARPWGNHVLEV